MLNLISIIWAAKSAISNSFIPDRVYICGNFSGGILSVFRWWAFVKDLRDPKPKSLTAAHCLMRESVKEEGKIKGARISNPRTEQFGKRKRAKHTRGDAKSVKTGTFLGS